MLTFVNARRSLLHLIGKEWNAERLAMQHNMYMGHATAWQRMLARADLFHSGAKLLMASFASCM